MKSKILVVALIGLLMAGGLVLASCDDGCSEDGECSGMKSCNTQNCATRSSGDAKCDC